MSDVTIDLKMSLSGNTIVSVSITLWLFFTIQPIDGLRILGMFPLQMRSQSVMGEELLKALAAKGHQVDVYSHFPLKKPIPNYNDFSMQGYLPALTNNVSYEEATSITDSVRLMDVWYEALCGPICDLLGLPDLQKIIHDPPTDPPYDLMVLEFSIVHCFIPFGRHLNIPIIGIQAMQLYPWQYDGFGNPVNLAVEPNFLTNYAAPMTFLERLGNFIMHHRVARVVNMHLQKQDRYVKKYFGSGFPSATELQKDIALMFVNDDAAIYGAKAYMPKVIPAALMHVVDHNETITKEVKEWLDESTHGCVLVTFGSMIRIETLPRHVIEYFYKSFKNIAPVRVLLKIAKPEVLPPGLPSNVLTQTWFQQGAVLKHKNTKAFVTHGGLMGTQESIYYEVPMVGIAIFYDQEFTLNAYVRKNMAIKLQLSQLTEVTFTNALQEVLKNPVYRESVKKVSRQFNDRPVSVMDNAIFWVEYIHRHGKDALKSSAEDVPWWQSSSLDIYAFFIAAAFTVVFICVKMIKVVVNIIQYFTRKDKIKRN